MERVGGSNPPSSTTKPSSQAIWWFLRWFMAGLATPMNRIASLGAIAQLVAHLHGMERVGGSNPPSSTTKPSSQAIWWFLRWFMAGLATPMNRIASLGAIAQLVAHLHGMERVGVRIPLAPQSRPVLHAPAFLVFWPIGRLLRNIPRKASPRGRSSDWRDTGVSDNSNRHYNEVWSLSC